MDPREKTWELSQSSIDEAHAFARKIEFDWYRVQSLAKVAWHTKPLLRFSQIVEEALDNAEKLPNPNRVVSCSAWVVRAMAERDDIEILPVVNKLLQIIQKEPHPISRADALLLLFEASYYKKQLRDVVLIPLLEACSEIKSWKQSKILSDIALILAIDDMPDADRVLELIQNKSTKRKTREAIIKRDWLGPHDFFPYYAKLENIGSVKI